MSDETLRSADTDVFASSPRAFFARIASAHHAALSYSEEFLWWSARLAGDTTFNVRVLLRLRGPLRLAALEDSIVEIARRHETLRTVFPMEKGVILRRVLAPASVRPSICDDGRLGAVEAEPGAWQLVLDEANRPFNVTRGPLFRSSIVRIGPADHLLQFTIHHLVIDGRSVDILLRELGILYGAYCRNQASPLPELPLQYAEYVARGRSRRGAALGEALPYWKAQLAGIPGLLDLPADGPRRTARHYYGQTLTFAFSAGQTAAIRQLARRHGTTVFVLLLTILAILLNRLSGTACIMVETPMANRRSRDAEGLIGLLVDLVALRIDVAANPSLPDLLASVRRTTLGAFDHAGVPIHVLVDAVNATVDASHSALCQVMFNLINMQERAVHLESLEAEQLPLPGHPHSKFDLMLTAHLRDTLQFQLLYKRDLFSELRMLELAGQFTALVDQALAAPDTCVDDYSLVTPRAEQVLRPLTTRTDLARGGIQERVRSHAHADTARVALADGTRDVSYGELDRRSDHLALDLVARGVRPGDAVAVPCASILTLAAGLLATAKAGAACVIVDSPGHDDLVINPDPLAPNAAMACDPQALSACARWTTETFSLRPGARVGALASVNPTVAIHAIFTALWSGGTAFFAPPSDETPDGLHDWLSRGIVVAYGTPAAWRRLKRQGNVVPSLRYACFVGDVLVREEVARVRALAPGVACAYFFGPEDRPEPYSCCQVPSDPSELREIVPVGRGTPGVELVVLNRRGALAGIGELGRLHRRGGRSTSPSVCHADEPVATAFMGRFLPDGDIDCLGDGSRLGSIDGYTMRLDEIASVLMRHPDVLDVSVLVEANQGNPELVAYVTSVGERPWPGEALDRFVRNHLPAYMVPRRIVRVPWLPAGGGSTAPGV